jgi:hypothetical protein
MKIALMLLLFAGVIPRANASNDAEPLVPPKLNQLLSTIRRETEREKLLEQIGALYPEAYLEMQVGGLNNGSISIRLNKRYELGARVRSIGCANGTKWILTEQKFWLTDYDRKQSVTISVKPLYPTKPDKKPGISRKK